MLETEGPKRGTKTTKKGNFKAVERENPVHEIEIGGKFLDNTM